MQDTLPSTNHRATCQSAMKSFPTPIACITPNLSLRPRPQPRVPPPSAAPRKCRKEGAQLPTRLSSSSSELGRPAQARPSVRRWVAKVSSRWTFARCASCGFPIPICLPGRIADCRCFRSSTQGPHILPSVHPCRAASPSAPTGHSTSISGRRRPRGC
jgi:hypothetical protein